MSGKKYSNIVTNRTEHSVFGLKFVKHLLCSELTQTVTCDKAIYINCVSSQTKFQYDRVEMIAVQTTAFHSKKVSFYFSRKMYLYATFLL